MSSKRSISCINDADNFCYVCGLYIEKQKKHHIFTNHLQQMYEHIFKVSPTSHGHRWAPNFVCLTCKCRLNDYYYDYSSARTFIYSRPMIWRQIWRHDICYFCLSQPSGVGKNFSWIYPTESTDSFDLPIVFSDTKKTPM